MISRRKSKFKHERNNWRRDRCMIYSCFEGTECGEVVHDLVHSSLLRGIGFDKDEETLLKMAERYAHDCGMGIIEWSEEDIPVILKVLREFRKTDKLPDYIIRRCNY